MNRKLPSDLRGAISKMMILLLFAGTGFASCTYYTNDFDPSVAPDDVSFEADIIPIFEANCNSAGCHSGTIPPDLRPDAAYINLVGLEYVVPGTQAEDNILYQSIDGGSMSVYASNLDRSYIEKWINEGALNN